MALYKYRAVNAAGDVAAGELEAANESEIVDRLRDQGLMPMQVEAALAGHEDVAAVMVSASPDREWGQRVVARVVPRRRSAPPTLEALRAYAGESVARHKLPRELIIVDHLESTALGKIRRR